MANKKNVSVFWTLGLLAIGLALGMTVIGCGGDDGGGSGGGGNPLVGSWADDLDNPTSFVLFTASKIYYSTTLTPATGSTNTPGGTANTTQYLLPIIHNTPNEPTYILSGNTLTVNSFYLDTTGASKNVTYTRREGSSKTGIADIWIPAAATDDTYEHLLFIAEGNKVYYSRKVNWNYDNYEYRAADKEVRWANLTTTPSPATILPSGSLSFKLPDQAGVQTYKKSNADF
ncbi:MAG: hypothetical protein LBK73_02705 [Treponema sp.]|jgi:hypothetical protein|nr:hypothetical protein [Treponema sp.]